MILTYITKNIHILLTIYVYINIYICIYSIILSRTIRMIVYNLKLSSCSKLIDLDLYFMVNRNLCLNHISSDFVYLKYLYNNII